MEVAHTITLVLIKDVVSRAPWFLSARFHAFACRRVKGVALRASWLVRATTSARLLVKELRSFALLAVNAGTLAELLVEELIRVGAGLV